MDKVLLAEYRASTYLVCLDTLRWSPIHIGKPLPAALQALVGERSWAFITAWNPRSIRRAVAENFAAQQQLLLALQASAGLSTLYPGVGIGSQGWYEPGFFVVGLAVEILDELGAAHAQNAYVQGCGPASAGLRLLQTAAAAGSDMDNRPWHCGQSRE